MKYAVGVGNGLGGWVARGLGVWARATPDVGGGRVRRKTSMPEATTTAASATRLDPSIYWMPKR